MKLILIYTKMSVIHKTNEKDYNFNKEYLYKK